MGVLHNTLKRTAQEMLRLDLSKVKTFIKVMEVNYSGLKPTAQGAVAERSVLFIPVWDDAMTDSTLQTSFQVDNDTFNEAFEAFKKEEKERISKERKKKKQQEEEEKQKAKKEEAEKATTNETNSSEKKDGEAGATADSTEKPSEDKTD